MKKLILLVAMVFVAGAAVCQNIQKGNLLGIHVIDETKLNPGVTMEQAEDFFYNKYIPAFQKEFKEIKIIPMKGNRGEHANKLGFIMVLKSEKDRAIYWNEDGTSNEKAQAIMEKLQPLFDEMNTMGTSVDLYTDWLVK